MSTSPLTIDHLVISKICGKRILDVGCGYGKWGFLANKHFWNTKNGNAKEKPFVTGLDIYAPNLRSLAQYRIYDELVQGNAASLPIQDKSFDTVLAIEIIEHLKQDEGYRLLKELERVATKCIIISTPNKKCFRKGIEDANGFNAHETHVSAWKIKTFKALGYRCYGVGVKLWPARFWGLTEFTYFSYRLPYISETLVCIKSMN